MNGKKYSREEKKKKKNKKNRKFLWIMKRNEDENYCSVIDMNFMNIAKHMEK